VPSENDPQQPEPVEAPTPPAEPGDEAAPATQQQLPVDERAAADELPSEEELQRTAVPATVRRAPKYSAFITVGALVGIVVGLVLAIALQPAVPVVTEAGFISFLGGHGTVRTVCAVAGGVLGAFVGGGLAVLADRRSRAR